MNSVIEIPLDEFTFEHTFKSEDFAPGVWVGTKGLTLTITKVDLQNKTITLKAIKNER